MMEPGWHNLMNEITKLHDRKNQDYGARQGQTSSLGIRGRFADIWRKAGRLKSLVWDRNIQQVSEETIRDTAIDLMVYAMMFVLMWDEEEQKKDERSLNNVDAPKDH